MLKLMKIEIEAEKHELFGFREKIEIQNDCMLF